MSQINPVDHINNILIIDDDPVVQKLIGNYLQVMGLENFVFAHDGEDGWQKLEEGEFDLIVMDWQMPKLGGLGLFNRIRKHAKYRLTPILVVSGFLEQYDFRLLEEFSCTTLMEKPFTKTLFDKSLNKLLTEKTWYLQNEDRIAKVLRSVKYEDNKSVTLVKQMMKNAPNPLPIALVAGKYLAEHNQHQLAKKIFELVLKKEPDSVVAMNELAKIYHATGQHKRALSMLLKANVLSPQSVSRLCLMGEVELNLKDPEEARKNFNRALEIDPKEPIARSGVVISDNMADALASPSRQYLPQNFASMLNSMGVAMVKSGDYKRGLQQYQSAFAFLKSDLDTARLAFNMGLGFMRWGKPDKALPWFERSANLSDGSFGKGVKYVQSLKTALEKSGAIDVMEAIEADIPEEMSLTESPVAPQAEVHQLPSNGPTSATYSFDNSGRVGVYAQTSEDDLDIIDDDEDEDLIAI